jgi:hypothetical protein
VKETIMTDINDLMRDFWRTSGGGADGESFFAMRHLLEILQECFHILEVCFDFFFPFLRQLMKIFYRGRRTLGPVIILPTLTKPNS